MFQQLSQWYNILDPVTFYKFTQNLFQVSAKKICNYFNKSSQKLISTICIFFYKKSTQVI